MVMGAGSSSFAPFSPAGLDTSMKHHGFTPKRTMPEAIPRYIIS
jgi:hypothetical protein